LLAGFLWIACSHVPAPCLAEGSTAEGSAAASDSMRQCGVVPELSPDSLSAPASVIVLDASRKTAVYKCSSRRQTLKLPDSNVFVGSEKVSVDRTVLSKGSYFLDCTRGEIFFGEVLPEGAEVVVEYRYLPFYLNESYCLRLSQPASHVGAWGVDSSSAAGRIELASLSRAAEKNRGSSGGLRLRGTKTLSLEMGSNRDAKMKQSLDMNVTGEISKGLSLTAVLTDRDLPIQPEGKTEALNQLDEIRVELQSQSFNASMGDCSFALDGASLLKVSRRLEGAQARGTLKGIDVLAAGSTLKGKWVTREFMGTEGRQGPYQLTTDAGAPCVVVAGTDKVWFDGVKLGRGESADYWIDYGAGKIYFTNRRPITRYSKISVEYEYTDGDYQKNFYAAGVGADLGRKLGRIDFLLVSEADQIGQGTGALSDEEKRILRQSGDAPSNQAVQAAAGGRRLVAPASKKIEDLRASVSLIGLDIAGEFAFSQNDLNTLSSMGDADNAGTAGTVSLRSKARGISLGGVSLGRVGFEGDFRSIDEKFRTFGNISTPFEYEGWALPDSSLLLHGEKRVEARTSYSPWNSLTVSASHGELFSSSGADARRNVYSFEQTGELSLSGRVERASSNGGSPGNAGLSRTVESFGIRFGRWKIVPSASYYSEAKDGNGSSAFMSEEVGGGISSAWRFPVSIRIGEKYRIEYAGIRANRIRNFDAITHSVGLDVSKWRSLSASCEYSRRDLNGYNGIESRRTELGKLFVSQNTSSGRLNYELNHLVTTLSTESSTKNVIYVGRGEGRYDSTGTFVGNGDYEVEIINLSSSALNTDAVTSATLSLRPWKGISKETSWRAILESLSSSSFFRSAGTLGSAPGPFSLLLTPMYTEAPSAMRSSALAREELELASAGKRLALRYRYELSKNLYHQYENMKEQLSETRQGVRLRTDPGGGVTMELEQAWRERGRDVLLGSGSSVSGRASGTETTLDLRYVPVKSVELAVLGSLSGLKDTDTGRRVRVSKFSPSTTYGAGGSTRARLALILSSYSGDVDVLAVGSAGAFISPNRVEIMFSLDHAAGEHLTLSTNVSSRKSTGIFTTDGRVEMRAHF